MISARLKLDEAKEDEKQGGPEILKKCSGRKSKKMNAIEKLLAKLPEGVVFLGPP